MYKILSLDGGGSWAIIQLLTLKDRYGNLNGHEILKKFDLVIANSGGSIVLAALAEDYSIDKAITLFQNQKNREQIFHKNTFKDRYFPVDYLGLFNAGFGPKYSATKKKEAFENLFPEIDKVQMNELPKLISIESLKIVVCTYDALNNRAKFFKSYSASGNGYDSVKLTQAINGSSNAPVQYFDFPARFKAKESDIFYEL
jgi:patatin-like phospholipase/acyl hydrolase